MVRQGSSPSPPNLTRVPFQVDAILRQNPLVQRMSAEVHTTVMRPAEMFFNTATEVYLEDGDSYATFMRGTQASRTSTTEDRHSAHCRATQR